MSPFHFGPDDRRLFGLFHPAADAGGSDAAALLCNPFGQEAVRSHRLYRVLAERLAASGVASMRFDYHGTGDSPGDDEAGTLDGWVNDTRVALQELRKRSGARRLVCVGARLGAVVAARASVGAESVAKLVLCDPVVNGPDYLAQMRVDHVRTLELAYSLPDPAWRTSLADDPQAFSDEAMGFGMSEELRRQIRKLGPHNLPLPPGIAVDVLANPDDAAVNAWFEPQRGQGLRRLRPLAHSFDWAADESRNTPLVPAQALSLLMAAVRD
jgi:pimeloyl-ACP methyl ester carboxylesterase